MKVLFCKSKPWAWHSRSIRSRQRVQMRPRRRDLVRDAWLGEPFIIPALQPLKLPRPVTELLRRSPAIANGFADQAALTSIFFAGFCASAVFGNITFRTPFLKAASILSASTLSGRVK